jgi:MFS family permease
MRVFIKNHHRITVPQELLIVRLLTSIGFATLITITSLFLQDLGLSYSQVGLVSSTAYVASFLAALALPAILHRYNIEKVLVVSLLSFAGLLGIIGFSKTALIAVALFLASRVAIVVISSAASILFKDDSGDKKSFYKYQSIAGSLSSFAWTITPFIAGILLDSRSFSFTYAVGGLMTLLGAIYLLLYPVPVAYKKPTKSSFDIVANIRFFISKKNLKDAFFMDAGANIWFGYLFTFVTLFMINEGYSNADVGLFITLTQVPLFLLEFKADVVIKYFGFRLPFFLSYGLMTAALLYSFFASFSLLTLAALVIASIGMAFVEPGKEIFVYEGLDKTDEERAYPIYNTGSLIGSIVVRLASSAVIALFGFKYSFLAAALLIGFIAYKAYKIVDPNRG